MAYRVYIACLAAYNNGRLHGEWVDLDGLDADDLQEKINAVLASSPIPNAEEWAFHAYEGLPTTLGENPSLELVCKLAELLEEHGEAFGVWFENGTCDGMDPDELEDSFLEVYAGEHDSPADFAENLLEDLGELRGCPETLRRYFDYAAYGRDLVLGGDVWHSDGFYFWNR